MSAVDKIRTALPEDQSKLFFGLVNTFGIREDDDRLVVLAAVAMLLARVEDLTVRAEAAAAAVGAAPQGIEDALARGTVRAEETVSEGVERSIAVSLDLMTNEVRTLVRELVVTEMSTASMLRSQAITDEVAALRRAATDAAAQGAIPGSAPASVARPESWMARGLWAIGGALFMLLIMLIALHRH